MGWLRHFRLTEDSHLLHCFHLADITQERSNTFGHLNPSDCAKFILPAHRYKGNNRANQKGRQQKIFQRIAAVKLNEVCLCSTSMSIIFRMWMLQTFAFPLKMIRKQYNKTKCSSLSRKYINKQPYKQDKYLSMKRIWGGIGRKVNENIEVGKKYKWASVKKDGVLLKKFIENNTRMFQKAIQKIPLEKRGYN